MKKITPTLKVLAVAAAFLALAGCNSISKTTQSSSMIVIRSVTGTTFGGDEAAYLQSDVLGSDGLVRVDNATVNLIARLVNPNPIDGPSQFNDVVLTSYRVTYELPTGPGTPGVDVPLPVYQQNPAALKEGGQTANLLQLWEHPLKFHHSSSLQQLLLV